jgi:hypothetical protein
MSRVQYGGRTAGRVSRRRVLALAAAAGGGAAAVGVAGLGLAGETPRSGDKAPLVVSLRDARTGTFDVFSGDARVTLTDRKLAAHLLKVVHRG